MGLLSMLGGCVSVVGYCVGLTQETRTGLSGPFEREAVVNRKEHVPAKQDWPSFAVHAPFMGAVPDTSEKHYVIFEGDGLLLRVNNAELFARLKEGEKVRLSYRQLTVYYYDYKPPNFHSKKLVGTESKEIFDCLRGN